MSIIGKTITGYKILKRIGKGGMGLVYLAEHTTLDKQAAIKVIDKKLIPDTDFQIEKRFKREAVLHSKLGRHPKIIELFNYIHEDNYFYILMEYFESVELATVIGKQTGPIPHERAIPIFKQILRGISHAHKRGIIHRDIKPSNILINKDDKIKIVDFGIAIEQTGSGRLTQKSLLVGSPMYMSPEHILEMDLNNTADIYLLGLTFYEMLAGKHPFDVGKSKIKKAQISETPKDPRVHYKDIPEHIVNAIMMALNKKPEDRQQSCEDFANQLEGKIKPTPELPPPTRKKWSISQKGVFAAFLFLGVFLFYQSNYNDTIETTSKITLKSPDGHEVWTTGKDATIYWNSKGLPYDDKISIDLLLSGNKVKTIVPKTTNDGIYTWRVDNNLEESEYYDIRISSLSTKISDEASSYFTIKKPAKLPTRKTAEEYFEEGQKYSEEEKYDYAVTSFTNAIELNDTWYELYFYRGWSYYYLKKYNNALSDANYYVTKNGNNISYKLRGWVRYKLKKYDDAIDDFNKCIEIDKTLSDCYNGRGFINYNIHENYNIAFDDFNKAIENDSDVGVYYRNRGLCYIKFGKKNKGCEDIRKADILGDSEAQEFLDKYCK